VLDQASGSALIPSEQQKNLPIYSKNPIIPPKRRNLAAGSLLDLKVLFRSTTQMR